MPGSLLLLSLDAVRSDIIMRNHSLLIWVLLFVGGLSGNENVEVSVMIGDSVTLHSGFTELPDDTVHWRFGEKIIATMNKAVGTFNTFPGEKFKYRLQLDNQTGSLTITNITTDDVGLYKLQIKSKNEKWKRFSVAVHIVESVSKIQGDSFSLSTDVKVQGNHQILWRFGDQGTVIADLNGPVEERWGNIQVNDETGDLIFREIRINQTGNYDVEINTSSLILHRKFSISVDLEIIIPVMEGDSVTLKTETEIQSEDLILWTFGSEGTRIAQINRMFTLYENALDGKFKDRLKLNNQTGSLTITDIRTTDTGLYHLKITSSSGKTIYKRFAVAAVPVSEPPQSSHSEIVYLIVGLIMGVIAVLVIVMIIKKKTCCRRGGARRHSPPTDNML